ncbi:MAG: CDP-diacylglycerol--glycerol-3-phosphate 3-phosphatidyltransferase [Candidatus Paracaedibacteraceae bacterium]|nr:CDP-diacylglycerol--glycerol-3-phosphate 3-phosphatidyltransferase [Candidatus Paracaedibacteraceae bacterium]
MFSTAANMLTFVRILLIPVLIFSFYMGTPEWRFAAAAIFITGCITDYLDGYVARTYSQISRLGQFLDPVADKLLVSTTLLLLAGFGRISRYSLIPAIVILSREILVSGLREHLSTIHVTINVSRLAKWKTAVQMLAICFLLVGDTNDSITLAHTIGEGMLWCAALLTLITGFDYVISSRRHF